MRKAPGILATVLWLAGCMVMDEGRAGSEPVPGLPPALAEAVRGDAARRAGVDAAAVRVVAAEAVTWRDGSLGCPRPGRAYTQALVPGWRIRLEAGGQVHDYHAGRSGAWHWCPPGQAVEPLPGGTGT